MLQLRKEDAIILIRQKLERNTVLRAEMDNPYVEKYVDEAIVAIVDVLFRVTKEITKESIDEFNRELGSKF